MSKEITLQEAALAWAQGKRVEAHPVDEDTGWGLIVSVGIEDGRYNPNVFTAPIMHRFRLAPEPPEKRYRPWRTGEVPVGAQIKAKKHDWRSIILGVTSSAYIHIAGGGFASDYALENHEHSIDNGKTWLPCGVEVSE